MCSYGYLLLIFFISLYISLWHTSIVDFVGKLQAGLKGISGINIRNGQSQIETPSKDDVALFLHTSGTTSRPKGVPLSQGNLAASLANIAKTYELGPQDRSLLVMPLFHVHGLMAGENPVETDYS